MKTESKHGLGHRVFRRPLQRQAEYCFRLAVAAVADHKIAGGLVQQFWNRQFLVFRFDQPLEYLRLDTHPYDRGHVLRNLVFKIEKVIKCPVIAFGPYLTAAGSLEKRKGEPQALTGGADAALKNEVRLAVTARNYCDRRLVTDSVADVVTEASREPLQLFPA